MVPEIIRAPRFDIHLPDRAGRLEAAWIGPDPEDAPTLIFLHEGLGCLALWRDFPARLCASTGCGALIYSRLGYGGSDACRLPRPVGFMHHEGLQVLPEVIRRCGIRDHLLVGHSDGGSIALIHAGGNPAPGLMGVVTLAAHVFCEDLTRQSIADAGRRYREGDLKARLAVYHGENTDCAFLGWHDVWMHPEFRTWNIAAFLPPIVVPVLAIQGQDDPYGSTAQIDAIRCNSGSPVTVTLLPDCGHAPHLQATGEVLSTVTPFVAAALADGRQKMMAS